MCNDFGETLLVSGNFHSQLTSNGIFEAELMGEEVLRGKNESVKIYAISKKGVIS